MSVGLVRRVGAAMACGVLMLLASGSPAFADSIREQQWHLEALNVAAAQKITKGDGVTVALIDTGVKANHRDLAGNVVPGVDFSASGTKGWVDTDGHGTAMAGLIAGHGHGAGDADGALGIAPAARVLPIRVLKSDNRSTPDVPKAIDEAVKGGAKVISMSFGTTDTASLNHALDNALKADVVLIAASGNRPDETFVQYPARYPGVVAVGATGRDGELASVSVTGKEVALTAPGADIVSTSHTGAYQRQGGTSEATAIVAGAAALVRAKYPNLSATEVVHRLTATATDKGAPGRDSDYGFGELNLVAALTADVPPTTAQPSAATTAPVTATSAEAAPPAGSAVRVDWVAVGVALAVVALVIVLVIVLIVWLIVRSRRRRSPPGPPPGPGAYRGPDQRAGESRRDTFRP